jgi:5'(3')-deoxyribonucleotidase
MRIAVDIDDCLAPNADDFIERALKTFGLRIDLEEVTGPSHKLQDYGYISEEQARQIKLERAKDSAFRNLCPFPGAIEAIKTMLSKHEVFFLTSRDDYEHSLICADTAHWLEKNGLDGTSLYVTSRKGEAIKTLGINLLVDDSLTFAKEAIRAGAAAIIFARPWNRDFKKHLGADSLGSVWGRCESWSDVLATLDSHCHA